MALKLKRFDAAKYIETPEDEVEILSEAFKSGHSGYIAAALGAVARAHGMSGLAEKTGLNRSAPTWTGSGHALRSSALPTPRIILRPT